MSYTKVQCSEGNTLATIVILQASRLIRYVPDLINHPDRLAYLPVLMLYLYVYQCVRVYSLLTIANVS